MVVTVVTVFPHRLIVKCSEMGALDVLNHLSALGVRLTRSGEAILATPRSSLTDEARAFIRQHKTELLTVLSGIDYQEQSTHWVIFLPNRQRPAEVYYSPAPGPTRAELMQRHPGAVLVALSDTEDCHREPADAGMVAEMEAQ